MCTVYMKTRATIKQIQDRKEQEKYDKEYDFWKGMDLMFRLESFKHVKELEKDKEVKSVMYRVLDDLTEGMDK